MYRLTSRLTIGNYQTTYVTQVETEESWKDLTSTATITLPKKLSIGGKPAVNGSQAVFRVGDQVTIELGYDFNYDTVFQGYVSNVKTTIPLVIKCEDPMWLFKQFSVKKTYEQVTVKALVDMLISKIPAAKRPRVLYSFAQLGLGKFRISNATGAQVFEELRKKYGIQCFFRGGVLYVGFAYTHSDSDRSYRKTIPLTFRENVIDNDLQFKSRDERKVKIKATCVLPDNKQFTKEAGAADGQVVQLFFYNESESDLQALATAAAAKYDFAGLEGSFTTFGRPYVRQGDAVQLTDDVMPERSGTYQVQKVTRQFGSEGYRQSIHIDRRLS
ncbi:hypothetical protein [Hymenobacter terrenus]|uniref:hypothetical protein n=1 Tax=Hymenobacter terrenus TaxID=1629124 RepID=UPI000619FCDF|nr:hypothetical protein [Hymenobacter terrenus]